MDEQIDVIEDFGEYDINSTLSKLIQSNFFYGYIILQMNKVPVLSGDSVKYMAVGCSKHSGLTLYYNPTNLRRFNNIQRRAVMEHEIRHITNGHLYFLNRLSKKNRMLANIAMDMAINCTIEGLPIIACNHRDYGFPEKLSCEVYYDLLLEYHLKMFNENLCDNKFKLDPDKTKEEQLNDMIREIFKSKGLESIDDHEEMESDISNTLIGNLISEAMSKAQAIGKLKGNVIDELSWMESKRINWKKRLRGIIDHGTIPSEDFKVSKNKTSRRYGTTPGITKELINASICCIIDTSGSMSDRDLSLFLGEIKRVQHLTDSVNMVLFDVGISSEFKYKFEKTIVITGRGGTVIDSPMVQVLNEKYKKQFKIVFTDGEICFKECDLPDLLNVVWVINNKISYDRLAKKYSNLSKNIVYFDE